MENKPQNKRPWWKKLLPALLKALVFLAIFIGVFFMIGSCIIRYASAAELPDGSYTPGVMSVKADSFYVEEGEYLVANFSTLSSILGSSDLDYRDQVMVLGFYGTYWDSQSNYHFMNLVYDNITYQIYDLSDLSSVALDFLWNSPPLLETVYMMIAFDLRVPQSNTNMMEKVYTAYAQQGKGDQLLRFYSQAVYDQGWDEGYLLGTQDGSREVYDVAYDKGYKEASKAAESLLQQEYDKGFAAGQLKPKADAGLSYIWAVASIPVNTLASMLNFNILGVNFFNVVTGLVTAFLAVWVLKKVGVI